MTRPLALLLTLTALSVAIRAQAPDLDPTAQLLAELIRVDTSNPPGNEARIADLLAPRLRSLGFRVDIVPTPQPGKAALFARLAGDGSRRPILLAAHADGMDVVHDEPGHYYLNTRHVRDDGYVFMFGAVQTKTRFVSFHLMPLYSAPELVESMSAALRKRMQGKSCLNFTTVDEGLLSELDEVTAQAANVARRSTT